MKLFDRLKPKSEVVTDADGNVYHAINLGKQVWMLENFRCTKLNDGTPLPLVVDKNEWCKAGKPAYCWHDNDMNNGSKFGALYNSLAVYKGKLAPAGWHVPSIKEFEELKKYLIENGYNWDKTKKDNTLGKSVASQTDWLESNEDGTVGHDLSKNNRSGFSAYPAGCRESNSGSFVHKGKECFFLTTSGYGLGRNRFYNISHHKGWIVCTDMPDHVGASVRLLRDKPA